MLKIRGQTRESSWYLGNIENLFKVLDPEFRVTSVYKVVSFSSAMLYDSFSDWVFIKKLLEKDSGIREH